MALRSMAFLVNPSAARRPILHRCLASVTGIAYRSDDPQSPVVKLFTKEGCTLCDKVKDVLILVQSDLPHTLEQVDIMDPEHEEWFGKYKYDIPVLHINNQYWIKHRIDEEEARRGIRQAREGTFVERSGEPNAAAMELRQAERANSAL